MDRRGFFKAAGLATAGAPFWMGLAPEDLWGAIPSGIKITGIKTMISISTSCPRFMVAVMSWKPWSFRKSEQ